ncbi:hypothetical protein GOODEAATRI_010427 [Goodea atripinnis]|uniref:Uncharacterized protein n=1 Tax=Goodea atripinnis TaxID=208336 RepID=A0ABV0NJ15_9TELE
METQGSLSPAIFSSKFQKIPKSYQKRYTVLPVCSRFSSQWKISRKHFHQKTKQPQLSPFDVKEKGLSFEHPTDDSAPSLISKAEPRPPEEAAHFFSCPHPGSCSFSLSAELTPQIDYSDCLD